MCPVGVSVYVHVSHLTTSLLLWQFISLFMPAYVIYHMMSAIANRDFNTKPYVKAPWYGKMSR